ncbi:hypothetical protein [Haloarchaeobius litoreus]|uniref:HEAT repeat n=1 Tax=Haloarchaeobius litoreus TaxID=755306 RepID=A0ABD6DKD5_9EURY|nr:hypothetical protein [Haloarchaeobius litoreus]
MADSAESFLAALADGNVDDENVAQGYVAALDHPDVDVRRQALDELSAVLESAPGERAEMLRAVGEVVRHDPHAAARKKAIPKVRGLYWEYPLVLRRGDVASWLTDALTDDDEAVRRRAVDRLRTVARHDPQAVVAAGAVDRLVTLLDESSVDRTTALAVLADVAPLDPGAVAAAGGHEHALAAVADETAVAKECGELVGHVGEHSPGVLTDEDVRTLVQTVQRAVHDATDREPGPAAGAAMALGRIGRERPSRVVEAGGVDALVDAVELPGEDAIQTRRASLLALGRLREAAPSAMADVDLVDRHVDRLQTDDAKQVRVGATESLVRLATRTDAVDVGDAAAALVNVLDGAKENRRAAARGLGDLVEHAGTAAPFRDTGGFETVGRCLERGLHPQPAFLSLLGRIARVDPAAVADAEPMGHAVAVLGTAGLGQDVDVAEGVLASDARERAARTLGTFAVTAPDPLAAAGGIDALLAGADGPTGVHERLAAATDVSSRIRAACIGALGRFAVAQRSNTRRDDALAVLEAAFDDDHDAVWGTAAVALCQPGVASAVGSVERRAARDRLRTVLDRGDADTVLVDALADFGVDDPDSLAPMRGAIRSLGDDEQFGDVARRARILRDVDAPWARETLGSLATYPNKRVRELATDVVDHTE